MTETLGQLESELDAIDALIEEAAVGEDVVEWMRLRMRGDALPALIREARARPIREEVQRLEGELEELEGERQRALNEPSPEIPAGARDRITPAMARNARLGSISTAASAVGKERDEARERLAAIEAEGVKPLV